MTSPADEQPTYVACLTPAGTGAIATLALRGPKAWDVVRNLFRPRSRSLPDEPEPGRFWLGHLGEDPKVADDVVLTIVRGPNDQTPNTKHQIWLEIHCHGGIEVIRWLTEVFQKEGLRTCTWQELERMTAADPVQAEAAVALAHAATTRTAAILLDQHQGAFRRTIEAVLTALDDSHLEQAKALLEVLCRYIPVGLHLTTPWKVAVLGAPNVGKSSLVNALAGFQRSIVSPTPGTTRDVVTTQIALDGWALELTDTAGLRGDAEHLERAGIGLARQAAAEADLCLWLLDASAAPVYPDFSAPPPHLVINKVDLPPAWDLDRAEGAVRVSALTAFGLPELCQAIAGWLVPNPPPPGAAVPFNPEWCEQVQQAQRLLSTGQIEGARTGLKKLEKGFSSSL